MRQFKSNSIIPCSPNLFTEMQGTMNKIQQKAPRKAKSPPLLKEERGI